MPDWKEIWTMEEMEKELNNFKFDGPGFYMTNTDTVLVIPYNLDIENKNLMWLRPWSKLFLFEVFVWNSRFENLVISCLNTIKTISDKRTFQVKTNTQASEIWRLVFDLKSAIYLLLLDQTQARRNTMNTSVVIREVEKINQNMMQGCM